MADKDHWEVFEGKDGKWYFHRQSPNGDIVGDGGQGYQNKSDAWDEATRQASEIDAEVKDLSLE